MLTVLQKFLQMEGYCVIPASNGPDAREIAEKEQPDLILLDIMMPGESGLETCEKLKKNAKTLDIPIIFISAVTDIDSKVKGFEFGAVDYITKPFEKQEVLARVRIHLKLRYANEAIIKAQADKLQQVKEAQESILVKPDDLPEAHFGVYFSPIYEAGGDFYDVLQLSEKIHAYFVSDVSGHDLKSSYLTSALKALLTQHASITNKPDETMKTMNRVLSAIAPDGKYLTACYCFLNRLKYRLTIVNAGHPPVISVKKKDLQYEVHESEGDILGAFQNVVFNPLQIKVAPKDRFFLYSDGFIEGFGDLRKSRKEGIEILGKLCIETFDLPIIDAVQKIQQELFDQQMEQEDDLLLLGIEV
ncbi:MAG: response regulator receiver protein [Candidatus Magnetoglobus multicellularis str. Araruama]|uniref:Response regulator receiver protein n=1 Tax=Candidatus Magnetoglobus multicellularis str. Araruama TaxID=890399 RepID=A0A1V1P8E6_9BACT|nr:MAG: response regulator receiver protein [Candidatus Magnetoglobus multicellularis str. Araruama]